MDFTLFLKAALSLLGIVALIVAAAKIIQPYLSKGTFPFYPPNDVI